MGDQVPKKKACMKGNICGKKDTKTTQGTTHKQKLNICVDEYLIDRLKTTYVRTAVRGSLTLHLHVCLYPYCSLAGVEHPLLEA